MNHQEDDQNPQQRHIHGQENDSLQQQHLQEQEEINQKERTEHEKDAHIFATMSTSSSSSSSSSPPHPIPQQESFDSPPVVQPTHSSHGYVFSSAEVLHESTPDQTTSHAYFFSPSSSDINPAKPPSPPPPQASVPVSKIGSNSKTQNQEAVIRKRPFLGRKEEALKKKALLGCRAFGFLCCLVSFSIMAADKNKGWAIDSFYRYKEFRYCLSVTVIGFVYSGLQAYDLAYSLAIGIFTSSNLRCLLDFSLDQVLTYLLLSASSSAAYRVEDWESNWGKDKFPSMAKSSVVLSFLAFVAFALCSFLSGQILFTPKPA